MALKDKFDDFIEAFREHGLPATLDGLLSNTPVTPGTRTERVPPADLAGKETGRLTLLGMNGASPVLLVTVGVLAVFGIALLLRK